MSDRPAAFLMLMMVVLITTVALAFDEAIAPPLWVHVLLWVPITAATVLACIRFVRALLLARQFRKVGQADRVVGGR